MLNSVLTQVLRNGLNGVLGGTRGGAGGAGLGGAMGGLAGQAAIAAALGLLMRRGGAGRLLKLGGMAALGTMAYKAWQEHQAKQAARSGAPAPTAPAAMAMAAPSVGDAPDPGHDQALLVAMIAAAKSDGHVDDNERAHIEQALRQGGAQAPDPELLAWLDTQLKSPLNAAEVARPAQGQPELAAKLYLVSVVVASGAGTGAISASEQTWLDTLGRELQLPDDVRASLQRQAAQLG